MAEVKAVTSRIGPVLCILTSSWLVGTAERRVFAVAQERPAERQEFAVVSVKQVADGDERFPLFDLRGLRAGRLVISAMPLREIILYSISEVARTQFDLDGGPPTLMSTRFDIEARFEPELMPPVKAGRPPERLLSMLRTLLADRFKLRVRVEVRNIPAFALVLASPDGRLGPHLSRSTTTCPPTESERSVPIGDTRPCAMSGERNYGVKANGVPIASLAGHLELMPEVRRLVENETGLAGLFDFTLNMDSGEPLVSVFTALEEQLGLKLKAQSRRSEVLIVDHVEPPTPN
jgi:uncharacterized protein (TIGR03435 family)